MWPKICVIFVTHEAVESRCCVEKNKNLHPSIHHAILQQLAIHDHLSMFETSWCWAPLANTPAPGIWAAPGSSSKIPNRNYEIPILLGVKIQLLGFQRPIIMSWILCGIILWMAMWTQIWDLKGSLRWHTRMYKTAWISINANPHDIYIYIYKYITLHSIRM